MLKQTTIILIIDDDPVDCEMYRRYLLQDNDYRYIFLEAQTGRGGLELYYQHQPDCILLNFLLPDMDGLEFLGKLKTQVNIPLPSVIILTGQGNEIIAVKAMKSGAADYLIKGDTNPKQLQQAVSSAIEEATLRQELQKSEERFRTSVENMMDCFGIYSGIRDESNRIVDFRVDYVNAAACENNRMTKEEQIGKGLCEILPAHRENGLFEEYCQVVETGALNVIKKYML